MLNRDWTQPVQYVVSNVRYVAVWLLVAPRSVILWTENYTKRVLRTVSAIAPNSIGKTFHSVRGTLCDVVIFCAGCGFEFQTLMPLTVKPVIAPTGAEGDGKPGARVFQVWLRQLRDPETPTGGRRRYESFSGERRSRW